MSAVGPMRTDCVAVTGGLAVISLLCVRTWILNNCTQVDKTRQAILPTTRTEIRYDICLLYLLQFIYKFPF
jgi:hypothetical protein